LDAQLGRHNTVLQRRCFNTWLVSHEHNTKRHQEAERMRQRNTARAQAHLLLATFKAWWESVLGVGSGREVARRNADRCTAARERLVARLARRGMRSDCNCP
jgi:hypothetical protein